MVIPPSVAGTAGPRSAAATVILPSVRAATISVIGMSIPVFRRQRRRRRGRWPCLRPWRRFGRRAAPERKAEAIVARLLRGAGQRQIAEPRQARQRFGPAPQRLRQAVHLGVAAGHQRRARAVAQPGADGDAAGDGDDVLQRAAEFGADHVGRCGRAASRWWTVRLQASPRSGHRAQARVSAVGRPRAISAAKLGPVSTAAMARGQVSAMIARRAAPGGKVDPLGAGDQRVGVQRRAVGWRETRPVCCIGIASRSDAAGGEIGEYSPKS